MTENKTLTIFNFLAMTNGLHTETPKYARLSCIVLAAGASTRLGHPKQHVTLFGKTLFHRACELALRITDAEVIAVLGYNAHEMKHELAQSICRNTLTIVQHDNWEKGMGRTLVHGINALSKNIDGALVLTVDQWRINATDLLHLKNVWRKHPSRNVASRYANTLGVPVIFTRSSLTNLRSRSHPQTKHYLMTTSPLWVDLPNASIDLDTPKDLQTLKDYENAAKL